MIIALDYINVCNIELDAIHEVVKSIGDIVEYAIVKHSHENTHTIYVYVMYRTVHERYTQIISKNPDNAFAFTCCGNIYIPSIHSIYYDIVMTMDTLMKLDALYLAQHDTQLDDYNRRNEIIRRTFTVYNPNTCITDYMTTVQSKNLFLNPILDNKVSITKLCVMLMHNDTRIATLNKQIESLLERVDILLKSTAEWRARIEYRLDRLENNNE